MPRSERPVKRGVWQEVLDSIRRRWHLVAGGLFSIVLMDVLHLYSPQLIKQAVDGLALDNADSASLLHIAGALAGLALLVTVLRMLGRPLFMALGRRVERDLRDSLGMRLLAQSQSFFDGQTAGQIMARATYDLNNLRLAAGYGVQAAWDSILTLALAVFYMLWLSPCLTLLAALPVLSIPWLTRRQSILFHNCHQRVQSSFSDLSEEAHDCMGAIRLVKVHNLARAKRQGFAELSREHKRRNLELAEVSALYLPVMNLVTHLSQGVVWGAGGALAVLGYISPGDIVAFSAYVVMMKTPLVYSGYLINLYQRARSSGSRLQEIYQGPDLAEPCQTSRNGLTPKVSAKGLCFSYPGEERPVLCGLDLDLNPGGITALAGLVGSGKSSLLKLLAGLYPAPPKSIFLGGRDLTEIPLPELHGLVGLVTQEPFVFSATVRENLRMAAPQAGPEELWQVLRLVGLADEIRALPQGLETELGEHGHTLSGGQKARLAIARALLPGLPVLLLDDALSAVDPLAESEILQRIIGHRQGKITLIVSHRPSSLGVAREVMLLDQGRLAGRGTHEELLSFSSLYRRLTQRQNLLSKLGEN